MNILILKSIVSDLKKEIYSSISSLAFSTLIVDFDFELRTKESMIKESRKLEIFLIAYELIIEVFASQVDLNLLKSNDLEEL